MIRQNLKNLKKNRVGKPHAFQSGFFANRLMREVRDEFPNAALDVYPVKSGKGRVFLIRKIEDGVTSYWGGIGIGFVRIEGEA